MLSKLAPWMAAALLAVSCGSDPRPLNTNCRAANQCASGLQCLDILTYPTASGCQANAKICTITCTTTADCGRVDPSGNFRCVAGCAGQNYCLLS